MFARRGGLEKVAPGTARELAPVVEGPLADAVVDRAHGALAALSMGGHVGGEPGVLLAPDAPVHEVEEELTVLDANGHGGFG